MTELTSLRRSNLLELDGESSIVIPTADDVRNVVIQGLADIHSGQEGGTQNRRAVFLERMDSLLLPVPGEGEHAGLADDAELDIRSERAVDEGDEALELGVLHGSAEGAEQLVEAGDSCGSSHDVFFSLLDGWVGGGVEVGF